MLTILSVYFIGIEISSNQINILANTKTTSEIFKQSSRRGATEKKVEDHCSTHILDTHCCTMCHCNQHKLLSALQVRRPGANHSTQRYKTEQFITAKISGNALKQGSRAHSVPCQRSSQLPK